MEGLKDGIKKFKRLEGILSLFCIVISLATRLCSLCSLLLFFKPIATSQMFVSAPRTEDHLPATRNGALADTNVTAFQTSIDGLITAARYEIRALHADFSFLLQPILDLLP